MLALALAAAPAAAQERKVLVSDPSFQTPGDPVEQLAATLLDSFTAALDSSTECDILSSNDLRAMVSLEQARQLLGGGDAAFVDEIIGSLGADTLVVWQIGRLGGTYVVNARALRDGSGVASSTTRASNLDLLQGAVQQAGAQVGAALDCRKPGVDYVIYKIEATFEQREQTAGHTSALTGTVTRIDTIEIPPGFFATPTGRARVDEVMRSEVLGVEHMSQCPSPTGFRDFPAKLDQFFETRTVAEGATEPSVDIEDEGAFVRIEASVSEFLPRTHTKRDWSNGYACGRPTPPTDSTDTSDAVSMAIEGINFDIVIPRDGSTSVQQPFELNGWKGTATLTWKPKGAR